MSSSFVIKETIYGDQDPESYFSEVSPSRFGSPAFIVFNFLDRARKFNSVAEAEKVLKQKEFESHKCIVVPLTDELKRVVKGFYLEDGKKKFHYVPKNYPLGGKSEFACEKVIDDLINFVEAEIAKESEDLQANFSWAHDINDQLKKKREGILKKYGFRE